MSLSPCVSAGSGAIPGSGTDHVTGVFQCHCGRQRCWSFLEEGHLQGHLQAGQWGPRDFQISQLSAGASAWVVIWIAYQVSSHLFPNLYKVRGSIPIFKSRLLLNDLAVIFVCVCASFWKVYNILDCFDCIRPLPPFSLPLKWALLCLPLNG